MENEPLLLRCAVVGRGRMGSALAARLRDAGVHVCGPLGREPDLGDSDVVLLAVPDGEIAAAARAIAPGPLVGHLSGATTLDPLRPHEAFSLHPLMTVTGAETSFEGAAAAIAGSTERSLTVARRLAELLGLRPVEVADADRAAYHAAASIAANFLVALEGAAERLAATAGVDRAALAPLVEAAARNWAALGSERALTGPIARGDHETVARQRAAVAERCPELLGVWDALAALTHEIASVPA
jgi:predicted short-subunit dehydrogenase-like oxidoreductase (DUF2520 family)